MDLLISQSRLPVQWNPASLPFFAAAALSAWLVVLGLGASQRAFGPSPHLAGPVRRALGLVRGDRSGPARPVRTGRDSTA